MAITHVNTQFGTPNLGSSPGTSTTSVVTKPTGLAVGDVMLAFVNSNKAGITGPSGWTRLSTSDSTANLYRTEIWYIVATSTQTAASSFTWTNADGNAPMWAAISAYRGVNQAAPINAWNVSIGTTANPVTGPSLTTTSPALVVHFRSVRDSSGTSTFSSTVTNERFDNGNHGTTVSYGGAAYDSGAETAAGTILGVSITRSSGTQSDSLSATVALATANVSITPGVAAATAACVNSVPLSGVGVAAGKASVTAAVPQVTALAGRVAFPGSAAAVVAVRAPAHNAPAGTANATSAAGTKGVYYGAPAYRTLVVPFDSRIILIVD